MLASCAPETSPTRGGTGTPPWSLDPPASRHGVDLTREVRLVRRTRPDRTSRPSPCRRRVWAIAGYLVAAVVVFVAMEILLARLMFR